MFDVIVKDVFDRLDYEAMYANAIACRCIEDCRVPLVAAGEDEAIRVAIKWIRGVAVKDMRIVRIKNPLQALIPFHPWLFRFLCCQEI